MFPYEHTHRILVKDITVLLPIFFVFNINILGVSRVNLLADSNIGSFKDADSVTNISRLKHTTFVEKYNNTNVNYCKNSPRCLISLYHCFDAHNKVDPKDLLYIWLPHLAYTSLFSGRNCICPEKKWL